jgi:urease accessory protein
MVQEWLVLQLADATFPSGGFAHSGGLEAAMAAGAFEPEGALERWLHDALWQAGRMTLPFVSTAHGAPDRLLELDHAHDAALRNRVLNHASRSQGRGHLDACMRSLPSPELGALRDEARKGCQHLAPIFGASLAVLGVDRDASLRLHLHSIVRGLASAAVRLSLVGPAGAQHLHGRAAPILDAVLAGCADLDVSAQTQVAPLHDLLAGGHELLDSRLFAS